jgi:hypothetical protein
MDIPHPWDPCCELANREKKRCGQSEDPEEEQVEEEEVAAWAEVKLEPEEEEWAINLKCTL